MNKIKISTGNLKKGVWKKLSINSESRPHFFKLLTTNYKWSFTDNSPAVFRHHSVWLHIRPRLERRLLPLQQRLERMRLRYHRGSFGLSGPHCTPSHRLLLRKSFQRSAQEVRSDGRSGILRCETFELFNFKFIWKNTLIYTALHYALLAVKSFQCNSTSS